MDTATKAREDAVQDFPPVIYSPHPNMARGVTWLPPRTHGTQLVKHHANHMAMSQPAPETQARPPTRKVPTIRGHRPGVIGLATVERKAPP
jgi:hypothetical protein